LFWWIADLSTYLTNEPTFLNIDALADAEFNVLRFYKEQDTLFTI